MYDIALICRSLSPFWKLTVRYLLFLLYFLCDLAFFWTESALFVDPGKYILDFDKQKIIMLTRGRSRTLNSQARELVMKLHNYFERESQYDGPLLLVTQVVDRVSEALAIDKRTVSKIVTEKYSYSGKQ